MFRNQERRARRGMKLVGVPWGQHIVVILDIVVMELPEGMASRYLVCRGQVKNLKSC